MHESHLGSVRFAVPVSLVGNLGEALQMSGDVDSQEDGDEYQEPDVSSEEINAVSKDHRV